MINKFTFTVFNEEKYISPLISATCEKKGKHVAGSENVNTKDWP